MKNTRMKKQMYRVTKIGVRVMVVIGCAVCLSSCGTIGSLLSYLINLPLNILDAVIPG